MSITIFCDYKGRIPAFMPKMAYFYGVFLYFWYVSYILLTCLTATISIFYIGVWDDKSFLNIT